MRDPVIATIDNVLHDFEVSGDAMRWTPVPRSQPQLTPMQVAALRRNFAAVGAAISNAMKGLTKTFEQAGRVYLKFAHQISQHDRIRCPACQPYSNPRPLAFGAEYRRRSKRR